MRPARPVSTSEQRPGPVQCAAIGCAKDGVVLLNGQPFCGNHYLQQVNALNDMGLTPRGMVEAKDDIDGTPPIERLVREPLSETSDVSDSRPQRHPF